VLGPPTGEARGLPLAGARMAQPGRRPRARGRARTMNDGDQGEAAPRGSRRARAGRTQVTVALLPPCSARAGVGPVVGVGTTAGGWARPPIRGPVPLSSATLAVR
jgi:hypothetical protein